jgi:hypothetical protein
MCFAFLSVILRGNSLIFQDGTNDKDVVQDEGHRAEFLPYIFVCCKLKLSVAVYFLTRAYSKQQHLIKQLSHLRTG